jgi:hypothetical protein
VDFGEADAALGVEVALDFHEVVRLGRGSGGCQAWSGGESSSMGISEI